MQKDRQPKGLPLAIDHKATSSSSEPAFAARPEGASVYHGFVVLEDVNIDGFTIGIITNFEAETSDTGDAFVIAPDGSRGGLVWEVSAERYIEQVCAFDPDRWGVWAISFPHPMKDRDDARKNLAAVLPDLKGCWQKWKSWLLQHQ